jgi:hypothetical protein
MCGLLDPVFAELVGFSGNVRQIGLESAGALTDDPRFGTSDISSVPRPMSPQATQPGASELDANIDALFNQLEPGAAGGTSGAASAAGETPVTRETALDPVMNTPVQAPIESPMPAADDMSALAGAEATAGNPEQPDTMLAEVSQEIEREAPRAMPAPVNAAPAIPAPRWTWSRPSRRPSRKSFRSSPSPRSIGPRPRRAR